MARRLQAAMMVLTDLCRMVLSSQNCNEQQGATQESGMHQWGGPVCAAFLKTHGLTPYLMHFLTLITMSSSKFTFSKKNPPAHICVKNNIRGPKNQM